MAEHEWGPGALGDAMDVSQGTVRALLAGKAVSAATIAAFMAAVGDANVSEFFRVECDTEPVAAEVL